MNLTFDACIPQTFTDPCAAIALWIKTLREKAEFLHGIEIELSLSTWSDPGVIDRLAEQLPQDATGFRLESDRILTASEYLDSERQGEAYFFGMIPRVIAGDIALRLIENLVSVSEQSLVYTRFCRLAASNFKWRGTAELLPGTLTLQEAPRGKEIFLNATVDCLDCSTGSAEALKLVDRATQATNIPFAIAAKITQGNGSLHESDAAATADENVIADACFEEALQDAAIRCLTAAAGRVPYGSTLIGLAEAHAASTEHWGADYAERVNFAPLAKRVFKSLLPEFQFVSGSTLETWFRVPVTDDLQITTGFHKPIAKGFFLMIGMEGLIGWKRGGRKACFHRLFCSSEAPTWVYANREQATAAINEAVQMIKFALPHWRDALLQWFHPLPKGWPSCLERRARLSARGAFTEAAILVRASYPDAVFIRSFQAGLSEDGRVSENGWWTFHFHSPLRDASLNATVPAIGRIRIIDDGATYRGNSRYILEPVGDNWIDSVDALTIANSLGGEEIRSRRGYSGVSAKLVVGRARIPVWEITYQGNDQRGLTRPNFFSRLQLNLDAKTGQIVPP